MTSLGDTTDFRLSSEILSQSGSSTTRCEMISSSAMMGDDDAEETDFLAPFFLIIRSKLLSLLGDSFGDFLNELPVILE